MPDFKSEEKDKEDMELTEHEKRKRIKKI